MSLGDDSQVKVISRLMVEYADAIKGVRDLASAFRGLDRDVTKAQDRFNKASADIARQVQSGIGQVSSKVAGIAQSQSAALKRSAQDTARVVQDVKNLAAALPGVEAKIGRLQNAMTKQGLDGSDFSRRAAGIRAQVNQLVADSQGMEQLGVLGAPLAKRIKEATAEAARELRKLEGEFKTFLANTQLAAEGAKKNARDDERLMMAQQRDRAQKQRMYEGLFGAGGALDRQTEARARAQEQLQQRLTQASERQRLAAEQALPQMQAQVAALQSRMRMEGVSNLQLKAGADFLRLQTSRLLEQLAAKKNLTAAEVKQTQELQRQIKVLQAQVKVASADANGTMGGQLNSMLGRRLSWFATGALAFGGMQTIRTGLEDIKDIELRMVQLGRVMEDPLFKIDAMRKRVFELGREFGFSFQQVQDITLRWAQAGYDAAESLELTRASLLALNTAELNAEQATQSLIGIMAQWGLEANSLVPLIDKINKVADDYAVSSQDLVDGLLRSSGAAKNANMSLEQTIALLTAMREASGRTGKEVGNALNSIISYMQRGVFLNTLQGSGIPAFADAAQQKLRPTFDILSDLSKNWDNLQEDVKASLIEQAQEAGLFAEEIAGASGALEEWTDLQRRDLMQAGAGVYRRNYLLALLNNFSQVYDVLQTQEEANGYSMRENARTMETYAKKVEQLRTSWQELGYALAEEGGVLDMLKGGVDSIRGLLDGFNDLEPSTKRTVIAIGQIALALTALSVASKQLTGVGMLAAGKSLLSGQMLTGLTGKVQGLVAALGGLGPAMLKLLPVVAILAGIAVVAHKANEEAMRLQNTFEETKAAMDANIKSTEAQAKVHAQNAVLVRKLADEYRALDKNRERADQTGTETGLNMSKRQFEITAQIEEALGSETAARLKAAHFSKGAADEIADAEKTKADEARDAAKKQIAAYQDTLRAQIQTALESIKVLEQQMEGWETWLTATERVQLAWAKTNYSVSSTVVKVLEWVFDAYSKFFAWWRDSLKWLSNAVSGIELPEWMGEGARKTQQWLAGLSNLGADQTGALADWFRKAADGAKPALDKLESDLTDRTNRIASGALTRQRQLLTQLFAEVESIGGVGKAGEGAGAGTGEFGTGDGGGVSAVIDRIVAETEALGRLNEATQRDIELRQARIAYNTREGATLEELLAADKDRADLISLLTKRQQQLLDQQAAAKLAQEQLATAQAGVNRSTEEGERAYQELGRAIESMAKIAGGASAEWWRLEKEKFELAKQNNAVSTETIRQLDELSRKYDQGLITLNDYVNGLARLEQQGGLTATAIDKLNEAQAKALKEQWTKAVDDAWDKRIKKVQSDIDEVQKKLKESTDLLDGVFAGHERSTKASDRAGASNALSKAMGALTGNVSPVGNMPSVADVTKLANAVKGMTFRDLGKLEPDKFAAIMQSDLASLRGFTKTGQDLLTQVGDVAEARLKEIGNELRRIDDDLKARLGELQSQLDALDEAEKGDERAKAIEEYNARVKALQDERTWQMLNGDADAAFKIAAIDRQLAEERAKWSEQQVKWSRDDQRQRIQDEMDAARESAETKKQLLEQEREALQEQQRLMTEALNAVVAFINSEIAARRDATEDFKTQLNSEAEAKVTDLENTKTWLEEKRKALGEGWTNILADMAAKDPEFLARGQSLVQNIIAGINSEKGALQQAIDEMNAIISQRQSMNADPKMNALNQAKALAKGGNVGEAAKVLSQAWGMTEEQAKKNLQGMVPQLANGAFVKPMPGGTLVNVAERGVGEWVIPEPKLIATIQSAMRGIQGASFGGSDIAGAVERAISRAMANLNLTGYVDMHLPDGTIQREVVKVFNGFGHVSRGAVNA